MLYAGYDVCLKARRALKLKVFTGRITSGTHDKIGLCRRRRVAKQPPSLEYEHLMPRRRRRTAPIYARHASLGAYSCWYKCRQRTI